MVGASSSAPSNDIKGPESDDSGCRVFDTDFVSLGTDLGRSSRCVTRSELDQHVVPKHGGPTIALTFVSNAKDHFSVL